MRNTFRAKLHGRKIREWDVMVVEGGERLLVQASDAIGLFSWRTGKGKLCTRGGYFPHLALARPYTFPESFVHEAMRVSPSLGGESHLSPGHVLKHNVTIIEGDEPC